MHLSVVTKAACLGAALVLVGAAGCSGEDNKQSTTSSSSSGSGAGGHPPTPAPISGKATVKFKARERLINEVAKALSLPPEQVCTELGQFQCDAVHTIALGGVDPYGAGIYEPLKASAVTTPIAVDRLILAACQRRAFLDFQDMNNAAIYKLNLNGDKLADINDASVGEALTELFHRVHLREPSSSELGHLRDLYSDINAKGGANSAQNWATLSCYAVTTMMESLFY